MTFVRFLYKYLGVPSSPLQEKTIVRNFVDDSFFKTPLFCFIVHASMRIVSLYSALEYIWWYCEIFGDCYLISQKDYLRKFQDINPIKMLKMMHEKLFKNAPLLNFIDGSKFRTCKIRWWAFIRKKHWSELW